MDDKTNNTTVPNNGVGNAPKVDLPSSHPATVPLPSTAPVSKPVEPSKPTPTPSAVPASIPAPVSSPQLEAKPEVQTPIENNVVMGTKAEFPASTVSMPEKVVTPKAVLKPVKKEEVIPIPPQPIAPVPVEPELVKDDPAVVVKKAPVVVPPTVEKHADPIMFSGPEKKGKKFRILFKYLSLILGGILFIGIVLAGYVFIKDMVRPEETPIVQTPQSEEIPLEEKPAQDNTSLDSLDNYFGNVDRELRILEDKTSFESVMNLSGTELR